MSVAFDKGQPLGEIPHLSKFTSFVFGVFVRLLITVNETLEFRVEKKILVACA